MNKKAGIIKTLFIIAIIIVGLIIVAGVYFYNFYTVKAMRICVSESNITDTMLPCTSETACIYEIMSRSGNFSDQFEELPEFLQEKAMDIYEELVFCDGTCKMRAMRGGEIWGEEELKRCEDDEREVILELKVKEAIYIATQINN